MGPRSSPQTSSNIAPRIVERGATCWDAKGCGAQQAEAGATRQIRGDWANRLDSTEEIALEHTARVHFALYHFPPSFTLNHPFPTFLTLAGSQEWSGDRYLAGQDLSRDRAAYKGLQVLPCLLFLHRCWCVEGDFHHGESLGRPVRSGCNQLLGLQFGK